MRTGHATVEIACPACDDSTWVEIEFLIESGTVPRTHFKCDNCGQSLAASACLDIDVDAIDDNPRPTP